MRRNTFPTAILVVATALLGCGAPPEQHTRGRSTVQRSSEPTPTRPSTGAWGRSFDAETNFPDYDLTLVRTSWVQLDHVENESTSMVIGFEPSPGLTLEEALADHLRQFGEGGDPRSSESNTIESDVLGRVLWSRASFDLDGVTIAQVALFAEHPASGPLLVGRFEFPSESDSVEAELRELVRAVEIVGPGL